MQQLVAHSGTQHRHRGERPASAERPPPWLDPLFAAQVIAQCTPSETAQACTAYPARRLRSGVAFDLRA
jgi:hypothetical protein